MSMRSGIGRYAISEPPWQRVGQDLSTDASLA
jgi:hypothetical protein